MSIKCQCRPGFQGDLCQICDACVPNPVILILIKIKMNFFIKICNFIKCLNNGFCVSNGLGSFACRCPPGTTGRTCDFSKFNLILTKKF